MNVQSWYPSGWTNLISRVFSSTVVWKRQFHWSWLRWWRIQQLMAPGRVPLQSFHGIPMSRRVFREASPVLSADTLEPQSACYIQASFNRECFHAQKCHASSGAKYPISERLEKCFANTWMPYQAGTQLWQCVGWSISKRKKKIYFWPPKSLSTKNECIWLKHAE